MAQINVSTKQRDTSLTVAKEEGKGERDGQGV